MSLGIYPTLTLAAARGHRSNALGLFSENIDPLAHKEQTKKSAEEANLNTFSKILSD